MAEPDDWVRPAAEGCILRLHVRPGARRSAVVGRHGDALAVRIAARPVEGAANRALVALLADALGVRPADVEILAGEHGREKRVRVAGLDPATARLRLGADVDKPRTGA